MKTGAIFVLSLLPAAALLGGCSRAEADKAAAPACDRLQVTSATEPSGAAAATFSVRRSVDLTFTVHFPGRLSGRHDLELRVYTPDGHLYRSLVAPLQTDLSRPPAARALPTRPWPVPERALRAARHGRGLAVDVPFAVAGTPIVSSGLYGLWRVEARLDSGRVPCGQAATFTITE